MSKKMKLIKSIPNALEDGEINEIEIRDEDTYTASDFYDIEIPTDGKLKMGMYAPGIANITGLTESQVASLHFKDYAQLAETVGKYIL